MRLRDDVAACIPHRPRHRGVRLWNEVRPARGFGDKLAAVQVTRDFEVPTGHQPSRTKIGKVDATKHEDRSGDLAG